MLATDETKMSDSVRRGIPALEVKLDQRSPVWNTIDSYYDAIYRLGSNNRGKDDAIIVVDDLVSDAETEGENSPSQKLVKQLDNHGLFKNWRNQKLIHVISI